MTTGEVAALAKVTLQAVHKWARLGKLNPLRIGLPGGSGRGGRKRLFLHFEVEKFLAERRVKARKARRARARRKDKQS